MVVVLLCMTEIARRVSNKKGTATVCLNCIRDHSLHFESDSTVTTEMYSHGGEEEACSICGLNVLSSGAKKVINDSQALTQSVKSERRNPFQSLSIIIAESWNDAEVMIESEESITNSVHSGAKFVESDLTSKKELFVDIDSSQGTAKQTKEEIQEFLELCGFTTTVEEPDTNIFWISAEL